MYEIDTNLNERMTMLGYEPWHTGGGCMCWSKTLLDGTQLMISSESALGEPAEMKGQTVFMPTGNGWYVGRYNDSGGFIEYRDSGTLDEVLAIADKLPAPRGEEQDQWNCS